MNIHNKFDYIYKNLFSHTEIIKQLVIYFLPPALKNLVDFSSMKKIEKSFITKKYNLKEADLIWELKIRGKRKIYIYIIIEFQTKVDKFMVIRLLNYITCFYLDLIKREKIKKIPYVMPVVIYRGKQEWEKGHRIKDIINIPAEELIKYAPKFEYYFIDIKEIIKRSNKYEREVLMEFFSLEASKEDEIEERIKKLIEVVIKKKNNELIEEIIEIIKLLYKGIGLTYEEEDIKIEVE